MDRRSEDWRETRHGLGIGTVVAIVGTIVIVAIVGALWLGGVILSGPIGKGNIIRQNNSAGNQIEQQGHFEDLVADYNGALGKIKIARAALLADNSNGADATQKSIDQTNLEGIQQGCIDIAQEFNAASAKTLAKDWKAAGLPATLDLQECS